MRLHAIFPQTEIGSDPSAVARLIREVEAMGFDGLVAYDHVLGADPSRPGWSGPYTIESTFHEVMVLFSYAAAITTKLELSTGVLILPQRQTALVAKQAAALDVLSRPGTYDRLHDIGGRLRAGIEESGRRQLLCVSSVVAAGALVRDDRSIAVSLRKVARLHR